MGHSWHAIMRKNAVEKYLMYEIPLAPRLISFFCGVTARRRPYGRKEEKVSDASAFPPPPLRLLSLWRMEDGEEEKKNLTCKFLRSL